MSVAGSGRQTGTPWQTCLPTAVSCVLVLADGSEDIDIDLSCYTSARRASQCGTDCVYGR